ncbi:hypothetical protein TNIN_136471 [Trichonephila inaurata madagascariensis]|uniref:Uncharacterized protein n=1 Tax=Trichonephila inaurata madagascariensis TaxID=2747483 RepID=A0A8X7CPK9_9ARAC|nr:hypothetical protein TNIN_136471 [Trichonephila inaurata madagascariensis]
MLPFTLQTFDGLELPQLPTVNDFMTSQTDIKNSDCHRKYAINDQGHSTSMESVVTMIPRSWTKPGDFRIPKGPPQHLAVRTPICTQILGTANRDLTHSVTTINHVTLHIHTRSQLYIRSSSSQIPTSPPFPHHRFDYYYDFQQPIRSFTAPHPGIPNLQATSLFRDGDGGTLYVPVSQNKFSKFR